MVDPNPPWAGQPGPSGLANRRTLPTWMDPKGLHGDVQFLLMKPDGSGKLPQNPFVISKSIDQAVGRIDGANPTEGGNLYLLKVRSQDQAEKLRKLTNLIDGTPVSIKDHPTLNSCQCVVSCREVAGLSNEELQENLSNQGVTKVYRFVKKVNGNDAPTNSMVLTITGTTPPAYIHFGYLRVPTRAYYPRPLMCFKCGKFGHSKLRCQHSEVCLVCGESANHVNCSNEAHCINCGGPHSATNRSCPTQKEEQAIVRIRVDLGISQGAAAKEYRSRCLSAQNATSKVQQRMEMARNSDIMDEKDQRIRQLENQVTQLLAQLKEHQITDPDSEDSDDSDDTMISQCSETTTSSTPKRNRRTVIQ